jgi:hypothetical protein
VSSLTAGAGKGCSVATRGLRGGTRTTILVIATLSGCSTTAKAPSVKPPAADRPHVCLPDRDRRAIGAMAGQFRVSFAFDETEAVAAGYALHAPYRAQAEEVVEIIEATENKMVLQHVLLVSNADGKTAAMKHWRQDWTFEDPDILEFRGDRTWERRMIERAEVACTWSQAVFEVDDGPRYESFGRWLHADKTSTWSSQETWRPLPRREYTKRNDYDLLLGRNEHVVTDGGWVHEQNNAKMVLHAGRALAREHGVNRYERVALQDAPLARTYLDDTALFWRGVREAWRDVFARHARFTLLAEVDGKPLNEWLSPLIETGRHRPAGAGKGNEARDLIARFVHPGFLQSNTQSLR